MGTILPRVVPSWTMNTSLISVNKLKLNFCLLLHHISPSITLQVHHSTWLICGAQATMTAIKFRLRKWKLSRKIPLNLLLLLPQTQNRRRRLRGSGRNRIALITQIATHEWDEKAATRRTTGNRKVLKTIDGHRLIVVRASSSQDRKVHRDDRLTNIDDLLHQDATRCHPNGRRFTRKSRGSFRICSAATTSAITASTGRITECSATEWIRWCMDSRWCRRTWCSREGTSCPARTSYRNISFPTLNSLPSISHFNSIISAIRWWWIRWTLHRCHARRRSNLQSWFHTLNRRV